MYHQLFYSVTFEMSIKKNITGCNKLLLKIKNCGSEHIILNNDFSRHIIIIIYYYCCFYYYILSPLAKSFVTLHNKFLKFQMSRINLNLFLCHEQCIHVTELRDHLIQDQGVEKSAAGCNLFHALSSYLLILD